MAQIDSKHYPWTGKEVTNEFVPMVEGANKVAEKRTDNDLFHPDWSQQGRNTEKMGEWNKNYEQSHFQGEENTGTINAPSKQAWQHGDTVAPVNQPHHTFPGTW